MSSTKYTQGLFQAGRFMISGVAAMARSYTPYHPGLLTDLYHPDSAYVAWRARQVPDTTFDLYARRAPFGGTYLLVAGLEMALEFVRSFAYTDDDLAFLAQIRD